MKKKISLSTLTMVITLVAPTFAQQNVGIGTATPDAGAMLEITATDKGILIPRLTTTHRTYIQRPRNELA